MIVKDSQSNPNRAADVARELIVDDGIDLMLVASTPETTNPVATTCEVEEIPCISSVAPWQPWFIGQQGNPGAPETWEPFAYSYHFFWGLEDIISVFLSMWSQLDTNKQVGALYPNDGDGTAWGDPNVGFPPVLEANGYALIDPGRYQNLSDDFSAQINAFKRGDVEIVTGVPIPPDFTTFWTQAKQQGFTPKAASIGKAILFPQAVGALGDTGHNLSSEVWWSPSHPFSSSLTGQSAAELAGDFTAATSRQWTQPIGFVHALFELAADAMARADDAGDGDAVAEAIATSNLSSIVGTIAFGDAGLPPFAQANVAKTPVGRRPVANERRWRIRPCHRRQFERLEHPDRRRDGGDFLIEGTRRGQTRMALVETGNQQMTILSLRDVSKSFGSLKVADGVSVDVPAGMALGHHRPQRGGEIDTVQPDHRKPASGRGVDPFARARCHS